MDLLLFLFVLFMRWKYYYYISTTTTTPRGTHKTVLHVFNNFSLSTREEMGRQLRLLLRRPRFSGFMKSVFDESHRRTEQGYGIN